MSTSSALPRELCRRLAGLGYRPAPLDPTMLAVLTERIGSEPDAVRAVRTLLRTDTAAVVLTLTRLRLDRRVAPTRHLPAHLLLAIAVIRRDDAPDEWWPEDRHDELVAVAAACGRALR